MSHCRTQIFSLVGRHILIPPDKHGTILSKKVGRMCFGVKLDGVNGITWMNRCEFLLPPLPKHMREPEFLSDNFDGFVYEGVEGF